MNSSCDFGKRLVAFALAVLIAVGVLVPVFADRWDMPEEEYFTEEYSFIAGDFSFINKGGYAYADAVPSKAEFPLRCYILLPETAEEFTDAEGGDHTYLLKVFTADPNGDGETNAADARLILRVSAELELPPENIVQYDADEDGQVTSADARLILRASAQLDHLYADEQGSVPSGRYTDKNGNAVCFGSYGALQSGLYNVPDEGLVYTDPVTRERAVGFVEIAGKEYYIPEDGSQINGFYTVDGTEYYFEENVLQNGFKEINGQLYFFDNGVRRTGFMDTAEGLLWFDADGKAASGWKKIDGSWYWFDAARHAFANGFKVIDGDTYYFDSYKAVTGSVQIDGKSYYFGSDCRMRTGYVEINGRTYLYGDDGALAEGFTDYGGATYYYRNGAVLKSWQSIDGSYYFFDRSTGKLAVSTKVDGIPVGADGRVKSSEYNNEKARTLIEARDIVARITSPSDSVEEKKLKCFKWVMGFPYSIHRGVGVAAATMPGWEMLFANDIFERGSGCCGSCSFAFAFLAVECGCKEVCVCDDGVMTDCHAWVTMNGNNNVYDVIFAEAKGFAANYDAVASDYRNSPPRKTYVGG